MITSVKFKNYKAFKNYSVRIDKNNIFVGKNNQGKSTIIEAFRILSGALRRAKSRKANFEQVDGKDVFCYKISEDLLPSITIKNVRTNYTEEECSITFNLGNTKSLRVFFSNDGDCYMEAICSESCINPSQFNALFPLNILAIPILSRIEESEILLDKSTIISGQFTHRASRHFRNYWYYFPENFKDFTEMVEKTWGNIQVQKPELVGNELIMFCVEDRVPKEIFWAGSGFQVWCQLLTYISKVQSNDILILDEPEIFLHPDLQRKLINILSEKDVYLLLATHSTEILGEVEPNDVVMINKSKLSGQRVKDIEGLQNAFIDLGSIQNLTLTKLAENKRVLFVEGLKDYKIIRRFAQKLGFKEIYEGEALTVVESEGFGNWNKLKALDWGLEKTIGQNIKISAIFDRDYRCDEEIEAIREKLEKSTKFSYILKRKEIENYLIHIDVLERIIEKELIKRSEHESDINIDLKKTLMDISDKYKTYVVSNISGQRSTYKKENNKNLDISTLIQESMNSIESSWNDLSFRLNVLSGKQILADLRRYIQDEYKLSLTDYKIIDEFKSEEIPDDIKTLLKMLNNFIKN